MSVDFDPVRIGGRRRKLDAFIVAGVVLAALVVAVIKPWEFSGSPTPSHRADLATIPSGALPSPTALPTVSSEPTPSPDEFDFWEVLAPVIGEHPEWGLLSVSADLAAVAPDGTLVGLAGRWSAGTPSSDGEAVVDLVPGDLQVYLVGLTYPPEDPPTDVRFWLVRAGGDLEWISTFALPPGPISDRPRLFLRPSDQDALPWLAGEYRIDVLRGERVERLTLRLADTHGEVPSPTPRPVTETRLVAPVDSDPSAVRIGLFATVDGLGVPFDVAASRPLDEAAAWLAADRPVGGGAAPFIATAFLPRATGLGVMLTPHASVQLAVMRRLAPSPLAPVPPAHGGISGSQGRTPYVVFAAPDGEALAPGVYAISVNWSDADGSHASTWHVELRPGPPFGVGS